MIGSTSSNNKAATITGHFVADKSIHTAIEGLAKLWGSFHVALGARHAATLQLQEKVVHSHKITQISGAIGKCGWKHARLK